MKKWFTGKPRNMALPPEPEPPRKLWRFNGGVHPPQNKFMSAGIEVEKARLPARLTLPLHQHIGEPAEPLVSPGEQVLKGQLIARANGYISAPVHAPTSGEIRDIGDYPIPHPSGLSATCLVIASDGKDQWRPRNPVGDEYRELDPSSLRNIIRDAGIVGLGGAGFPSFIKLNPGHDKVIDTLIVNGVECEPYITCDDRLMRERPQEIIQGVRIARHALQARHCLIAIEDNKPEAIAAMRAATADHADIEIVPVPTLYPQGSEKQLIHVLTGKEVPSDGLSLHVGVVGINVGTCAAINRAIYHDEPLISRYTTVTGNGVGRPRNLEVLFGTPMREIIEQCDGDVHHLGKIIMGGPMMGFALHGPDLPVIKTTNCVMALAGANQPPPPETMPCIRCGACMEACPVDLLPQQLYWFTKARDFEKTQDFNLFDCIECGCCSYVCPSNIPLVQFYRYAKGEIWTMEREREKADIARRRHEFRQFRQEREKAEKEARRKKKQASLKHNQGKQARDAKQAEIRAAMARAQKRAEERREEAVNRGHEQRGHEKKKPDSKKSRPARETDTPEKQGRQSP